MGRFSWVFVVIGGGVLEDGGKGCEFVGLGFVDCGACGGV